MWELGIKKINKIVKGKLNGKGSGKVHEIVTDSRTVFSDKGSIFFALPGRNRDGHSFIEEVHKRGIVHFVVSKEVEYLKKDKAITYILVENTLKALQLLSKHIRNQFEGELVTIVGSNGKTVVKEWLYKLLHPTLKIFRSPKSYNSQLGVPLSLLMISNEYVTACIEAGISAPGEMEKLQRIITPDTVIFTSLGEAHGENFSNLEEKAREKLKITYNAELLIYSPDFPILEKLVEDEYAGHCSLFSWSFIHEDANIYVKEVRKENDKACITVIYDFEEIYYEIPFVDQASIQNSLSCLSFLIVRNLLDKQTLNRFKQLEPVEMRIERKEGINGCILINDSYNSDMTSLKTALELQSSLYPEMKKTLILSDVKQTGLPGLVLYKDIARLCKKSAIKRIIGIGESISAHQECFIGIPEREFHTTTEQFLQHNIRHRFFNELILIKGARIFGFEAVTEILERSNHHTVLEINLKALAHNLNVYRLAVPADTRMMVMVKAFAYGTGSHEIAALLEQQGIDYLGVAFVYEGIKLREAGITTKIIVMNPEEESLEDMLYYKLEPEIYNIRILRLFVQMLRRKKGEGTYPVHIKIDTGMHRSGFQEEELDLLTETLLQSQELEVASVFSHLPAADLPEKDSFTRQQITTFDRICTRLSHSLNQSFIRHIANTAAVERFPSSTFDMVRLGIGLYGFGQPKGEALMNVSTLKTKISQIKHIKRGESVGYACAWVAQRNSRIGIIPIGYADGVDRRLSNEVGSVSVHGKRVPFVGRICMDLSMIDLTDIQASEGDEVIIFGDDFPADKQAEILDTIPYEIITGISERVKRIYIDE